MSRTLTLAIIIFVTLLFIPTISSTNIGGDYDKTGRGPVWTSSISAVVSFTMSEDGTYGAISNHFGRLDCINSITGEVRWTYPHDEQITLRSAISADGNYIVASTDNEILFFSTSSNTLLWRKDIEDEIEWNMYNSISDDGSLAFIVFNDRGFLYARNGDLVLEYDLGEYMYAEGKISGNGKYLICTDGCNYMDRATKVYLLPTNSTIPIWTKEVNGTGVDVDISRNGDVILIIQDLEKFKEGDPLGLGKFFKEGTIGTIDHSGGPALYSNNGSLIWAYEAGGVDSFDMDRDGNWFCISGCNSLCVLMDRNEIRDSIQRSDGDWVEYCSVSSKGDWMYVHKEQISAFDHTGDGIFYRMIRKDYHSRITTGTFFSDNGDMMYTLVSGRIIAFKGGLFPQVEMIAPSDIVEGEPIEFRIDYESNDLIIDHVEWFMGDLTEPIAILEWNETFTHIFDEKGTKNIYALAHAEEGSPGITQLEVLVEERDPEDPDPNNAWIVILIIAIIAVLFLVILKIRKKVISTP